MTLLTYAPILSFTNPPVTLPKISLFSFFFYDYFIVFFSHLGSIADSNASVLDFETSTKVRRPRSQAPCFYN